MDADNKISKGATDIKLSEIWLNLPDYIKNDPIMKAYDIQNDTESHSNVHDENIAQNKTSDRIELQIEEDDEKKLISFFNNQIIQKMRFFNKCSKITILCIIWIIFTIILIVKNEKVDNKKPTYIPVNKTKYNLISTEDEKTEIKKILVELNGPFTDENSNTKINIWIEWISLYNSSSLKMTENNIKSSQIASKKWQIYLKSDKADTRLLKNVFDLESPKFTESSLAIVTDSDSEQIIAMNLDYYTKPLNQTLGITLAAIILIGLYVMIIFEITHRTFAAILSSTLSLAALALLDQRPTMKEVMSWIDEETLLLLFSMMFIVSILSETGIFDYMAVYAYKITHGRIWPLVTCLCLFTCILASMLDNVTTILLMTPVAIRLCEVMNILPIPVLILMVIYSNIGGTLTPIGDPPNVIIASNPHVINSGVNFALFTLHMGTGLIFVSAQTYIIFRLFYKNISALKNHNCKRIADIKEKISQWEKVMIVHPEDDAIKMKIECLRTDLEKELNSTRIDTDVYEETLIELNSKYGIRNKDLLIRCSIVISFVITIFFLHSLPELQRISLGWTALLGVILLIILTDRQDIDKILTKIEWTTLLFFTSLFILMEALTKLGLIDIIGKQTEKIIMSVSEGSRLSIAIILILWVSALTSAFVDNIPLTTMMIKIAISLGNNPTLNIPLQPLMWALSFGACLGGNGTLIGASANVVCAGIAEQHGHRISFLTFFKIGFPIMLGSITVVTIYLMICHMLFQWH